MGSEIILISADTPEAHAFNIMFSLFFWFSLVSFVFLSIISLIRKS